MRLLYESETYTLPGPSTTTPCGLHKLFALTPSLLHKLPLKSLAWPKTRSAVQSVSGKSYSNTRLGPISATNSLPTLSTDGCHGSQTVSAVIAPVPGRPHVLVPNEPLCPKT